MATTDMTQLEKLPLEIRIRLLKSFYPSGISLESHVQLAPANFGADTRSMDLVLEADKNFEICEKACGTLYDAATMVLKDIRSELRDVKAFTEEEEKTSIKTWRDVEEVRRDMWACCLDMVFEEEKPRQRTREEEEEWSGHFTYCAYFGERGWLLGDLPTL